MSLFTLLIVILSLIDVFTLIFNEHLFDEEMDSSVRNELLFLFCSGVWLFISFVLEVM